MALERTGCNVNAIVDVPGWPGYAVTEDGHVISFWRRLTQARGAPRSGMRMIVGDDGRIMPAFDRKDRHGNPTGYRSVCLSRGGKRKNFYVHEIVLSAFVGARPGEKHQALHGNDDRSDNRLSNLRWGTVQENADDRERAGHVHRGAAWYRSRGLPPPIAIVDDEPEITAAPSSTIRVRADGYEHAFSDLLDVG